MRARGFRGVFMAGGTRARKASVTLAAVAVVLPLFVPAGAFGAFGAIAVDKHNGAAGWSWNYPTQRAAERKALAACHSFIPRHGGGGRCTIMFWVSNQCAAVVAWKRSRHGGDGRRARRTRRYSSGEGSTKATAIQAARVGAPRRARVLAWVCSDGLTS